MASWRVYLVAAGLLLACASASAAVHVRAATLTLPGIELAGVSIVLAPAADGRTALHLDAAHASVPALGWHNVRLSLAGEPERADRGAWKFAGRIATNGAPGNALHAAAVTVVLDPGDGTLEISIVEGRTRIDALLPTDQASHVQMTLAAVPLTWLRGVLASVWPAGRLDAGSIAGVVALDAATGASRVSGRVTVTGAELDSKSGLIAARELGVEGSFRVATGPVTSAMFDGRLAGGEVLAGPLLVQLPREAVGVHVSGRAGPAGIELDSIDYDDPAALRLAGSVAFSRHGSLESVDLTRFAATLPAAYDRYGSTLLQGLTGFGNLATSGSVTGALDFTKRRLQALAFTARNVTVAGSKLVVDGLDGGFAWRAGASLPATRVQWNGLKLYRLALGATRFDLKDAGGELELLRPATMALFGGSTQVQQLRWNPAGSGSQRWSTALAFTGIDVSELCKAFGWPDFGGTLGGAVPDIVYRDGRLGFSGGLSLDVFGGAVSVTGLSLEHPLGSAPVLAANIDMNQLNLAPLTGAFGFGQITGRLDGYIHGLRMVAWKPTAFSADLTAYGGGRISQNAIKSLTQVGGGGIAGGLQGIALRLFKTFGYSKIGLSCTLAGGVCTMGGIVPDPDPDAHGYTIVEGSGLPHITVIGHEREVDWATLVSRLRSATHGNAPVIRR